MNKEALEDVKQIATRLLLSPERPFERTSLADDALAAFVLLTLFVETGDAAWLARLRSLSHQPTPPSELRFAHFCRWNLAMARAAQLAREPSFATAAVLAVRKAHPRFVQAAGTERPRIWGALDATLENETDHAEVREKESG